jgi:hypothetical protein
MQWLRYKRLWYWIAQCLLWLSFAGAQLSTYLILNKGTALHQMPEELGQILGTWIMAQALAGLLLMHLVRELLIRSRLLSAKLGRQLMVVVLLKVGVANAYYGVLAGLSQILTPPPLIALPARPQPRTASMPQGSSDTRDFANGFLAGFQTVRSTTDLATQLGRHNWGNYTFVWLLGYLLIVAAERRVDAELRRTRAEASLSRAELELLHSQINPHFLFNTLNSIRALALTDPHRTRTALTQLADLLRYSLRAPGSAPVIPLREELAAVNDYLALEQTRFGSERLHIRLNVPEGLLTWPVPPAALLTLVENAVKHGVAATPNGGLLGLDVARQGADLTVTVSQPGHLLAPGSPAAAGSGLGLLNTRQRLRSLYGDAASLTLQESPLGVVRATLCLPSTPLAA